MSELCIFAGTTEGRRLAELLAGQPVRVLACVATDYGEALLPRSENVEISAGRLDAAQMRALFAQRRFDLVVDATHPYAVQVSGHIAEASRATGTEYLRLDRAQADEADGAVIVESVRAAADWLAAHPGTALLTTGAKELAPYAAVEGFAERFYVRMLPAEESLRACLQAGFLPSHIIAMQGPFSTEMNAATLKAVRADYLVTKDSGDSGGFREKLEAARQAGARCVVVGRPAQRGGVGYAQAVRGLIERFHLADVRDIDVVGVGMGGAQTMTREAEDALGACDCVIGAPRMLAAAERFGKPAFAEIAPDQIAARIAEHPEYRRIAVAMSGDAGFYSGAKKLLPLLAGHRVRVIPGLSALQVLCARLGVSWDDAAVVSLHGREGSVIPELRRRGKVFALTDGGDAVKRLCADLCAAGMGDARLAVGQRLSYADEAILRGTAEELRGAACAPLSAVLIQRPPEPAPLPVGLPDEAFLRLEGEGARTVPMTKSEIRAVSISKLRLTEDAVVWDIGAGTGSVSVEAALLCPRGRVFAVECREDAAALIEANAARFALRNLTAVRGTAPEALSGLPAPSHAFIGGSGGGLRAVVEAVLARNPRARIVVNAATLETVGEIAGIVRDMDFADAEVVQLSVARSRALGRYHGMSAMNPVWIAALQRDGDSHED